MADNRPDDHSAWRMTMARAIAREVDAPRLGVQAMYIFGSTKNATAGPCSDIDLLVHFRGSSYQRRLLSVWLDGWSCCLDEMNFQRTGYRCPDNLLEAHIVTDEDIANRTSFAVKIGAVTDAARRLQLGGSDGARPDSQAAG